MSASNPIKVSIILPVYNVEGYIERRILSLKFHHLDPIDI